MAKLTKGKKYTAKQISEAISFWSGKLARMTESTEETDGEEPVDEPVDEADSEEEAAKGPDVDPDEVGLSDDDEAEKKAEGKPIGTLNISTRMYRIHNSAVKKTTELLVSKFLNKNKLGDEESVLITNSAVDEDAGKLSLEDGGVMTIGLKVSIDKAHVKGFRKFMAVMLKEEEIDADPDLVCEGLFGTLFAAGKAAGKEAVEKAKASVDAANEELKKRIGVAGLQEYVKRFAGIKLAKNVKTVEPAVEEEGGEVRFGYYCSIAVEV